MNHKEDKKKLGGKMEIIITVAESVWRQAILDGWNKEMEEELTLDDIGTLDNSGDFQRAVAYLPEDDFKIEIKK